jgi:hypothetical protein
MKKITFFVLIAFLIGISTNVNSQGVAINNDGSDPDGSAMLDVTSTSMGILMPRMSSTERGNIVLPAKGLMVYDVTLNQVYMNTGTSGSPTWTNISTGQLWTRVGSYTYLTNSSDEVGIGTQTPGFISGATTYLSVSTPGYGSNQIASLELKGSSSTTYSPFCRIDFLSHSGVGIYNTARIETRITASQLEGELLFYTNGGTLAERMRIDKDGNVGIGTSSPDYPLHVSVNTGSNFSRAIYGFNESTGTGQQMWGIYGKTASTATTNPGAGVFGFSSATTGNNSGVRGESASIYGTGVYGKVTHSTGVNYAVYGETNSSDGYAGYFTGGKNYFEGDVGIGTDDPVKNLHIVGSATLGSLLIAPDESSSGDDSELLLAEDDDYTNGMSLKYDGGYNKLYFYGKSGTTNYGPHMTIERDGFVGIGTSDPNTELHVETTGDNRTSYFKGEGIGIPDATVYSENTSTGSGIAGYFRTYGTDASVVITQNGTGSFLKAFGPDGGNHEIEIYEDGVIEIFNSDHNRTVRIDPSELVAGDDAGQITLYSADGGTATIELDGSYGGDGRVTTDELQIKGGSDLAESFDIEMSEKIEKGMLLCIDDNNPGKLKISDKAYDRRVAGVLSGANGIKPGIIMGQEGTITDGEYLVTLTGRIYCWADATNESIKPGDMLTTSNIPGHAMKVTDYSKAHGAIIGKAMTSLKSGKGLVLILVTLH